jgi:hypothetical protein
MSNTQMSPPEQSNGELVPHHKSKPAGDYDLHNALSRECAAAHPVRLVRNSAEPRR